MSTPPPVAGDTPVLERWRQTKVPVPVTYAAAERRARIVLLLTLVTMVAELVAGYVTGSLALMADGWHMGSHAAALGITTFAYIYAKRNATNDRFSFGTGKVSALAGYSSALLLGVVAFLVATESVERLIEPTDVDFSDALIVAVIGLVVNLTSAFVLAGGGHHHHHHGHGHDHAPRPAPGKARAQTAHDHAHGHDHGHSHDHHAAHDRGHGPHGGHGHDHGHAHDAGQAHDHGHPHGHGHDAAHRHSRLADDGHDHNLRAAYLHVVADALTSVLAIAALMAGAWLGWRWLDPLVAFAAALLIGYWALGLLRSSSRVLLDAEDYSDMRAEITAILETDPDNRVADVRVWSLGGTARAAIVTIVTHRPRSASHYKRQIEGLSDLYHITIEVHMCDIEPCDIHHTVGSAITGGKSA